MVSLCRDRYAFGFALLLRATLAERIRHFRERGSARWPHRRLSGSPAHPHRRVAAKCSCASLGELAPRGSRLVALRRQVRARVHAQLTRGLVRHHRTLPQLRQARCAKSRGLLGPLHFFRRLLRERLETDHSLSRINHGHRPRHRPTRLQ